MENVTKTVFLQLYEDGELSEVVGPIEVGTEKRLIGRTPRHAADTEKGYRVVYIVV